MNVDIMKAAGFTKELELIKKGKCPFCEQTVGKFRDMLSEKEYEISGLCQECQDELFVEID